MAGEGGPVEVPIGPCQCPGTPHAEDVVWLRAKPDMDMGLAAAEALRQSGNYRGDTDGALISVLIRYGVVVWNCRDADGPIRVTTSAVVERLGWSDATLAVARKARELYWETVLAPLVPARSEPPTPTPKDSSTSPNPRSGRHTPTSPAQSSPSEQEAGTPSQATGA